MGRVLRVLFYQYVDTMYIEIAITLFVRHKNATD